MYKGKTNLHSLRLHRHKEKNSDILCSTACLYTEYAGLEITADSTVALRMLKTEMLVPVKHWRLWEESSFSALPSGRAFSEKMISLFDFLGPKLNFLADCL